jgi:sporulation protein YlmC with PRC-barrel domain
MAISDEQVRGRPVVAADGQVVGDVAGLWLDIDHWRVEALQLKLRKEAAARLRTGGGMFHAPVLKVPIRLVQSVGQAIVLSVGVDELKLLVPDRQSAA